jgi:hypothetical protein
MAVARSILYESTGSERNIALNLYRDSMRVGNSYG